MEPSTPKKTKSIKPLPIIKGLVTFVLVTLSLFHIFFSPQSKSQLAHTPKYKQAVKQRDSLQANYLLLLEQGKISINEYVTKTRELASSSKEKLLGLSAKRKELALEHSFRGRSSFHFWVFVFGLVMALFFFSCKSLYDDITKGSTFRFQFVSVTGIVVSFFWFFHLIFLTQSDFTKHNYVTVLLLCAVLCSVFIYFLVKYYSYKDDIILKQLSFIERVKTIHYPNIALKALYAEKYGEPLDSDLSIHSNVGNFEEDLKQTVNDD